MVKSGSGYLDSFHLTALVGNDNGRNLLVATNKVFPALREDSVPLEIWFL